MRKGTRGVSDIKLKLKLKFGSRSGLGLTIGCLAAALALGGALALAQLFGMGEYPGGHLRSVYQITTEVSPNPAYFTLEIIPQPDGNYKIVSMTEAIEPRDRIELGLFSLFLLGYGLRPESGKLDLTPLHGLDEREVEPGKTYILEGDARLFTQERTKIAGVDVIMGIYIHPEYPDQRALIAFPDLETRKLLPFPPLLQVERQEGGQFQPVDKVELVEFTYEPESNQDGR